MFSRFCSRVASQKLQPKKATVRRSSFLVYLLFLEFPLIQWVISRHPTEVNDSICWVFFAELWQVWVGPCPKNLDPLAVHAMSSKGLTLFSIPRADGRLCSILSWNDTTGCVGKMVGK